MTVIRVKDTRYAMAYIAAAWFENPAEKMKVIGITGTKGKTTTTYLVKSILENSGHKVGLIGTIEVIIGKKRIHAVNTTPESYLLQEYLYQMAQEGPQSGSPAMMLRSWFHGTKKIFTEDLIRIFGKFILPAMI